MRSRAMLVAATLVSCAALANSQPTSCLEDNQCLKGYTFCDTSVFLCRECLNCQDLKRMQLLSPNLCIKSIEHCGPCIKGFVEDRRGDINCVLSSDTESASSSNIISIWIVSGVVIVALLVIAAYCTYKFMSKKSFIKYAVGTVNIDATLPTHAVPTAPEPPPSYSPPLPPEGQPRSDEVSEPFIKQYQPPFPAFKPLNDHQNVSVFNPPHYVRLNNVPQVPTNSYGHNGDVFIPSLENEDTTPGNWDPQVYYNTNPEAPRNGFRGENDDFNPSLHDDNTTPSTWGPGRDYNTTEGPTLNEAPSQPQRNINNTASDFSNALDIARNTDLIQQPPPVMLRLQVTTDSGDESTIGEEGHTPSGHGASTRPSRGTVNVMNVNQIITFKP